MKPRSEGTDTSTPANETSATTNTPAQPPLQQQTPTAPVPPQPPISSLHQVDEQEPAMFIPFTSSSSATAAGAGAATGIGSTAAGGIPSNTIPTPSVNAAVPTIPNAAPQQAILNPGSRQGAGDGGTGWIDIAIGILLSLLAYLVLKRM